MHFRLSALGLFFSTLPSGFLCSYTLVKDYSGKSFFDEWDFYGNYDNLTNGDVIWVNRTNATTNSDLSLAYINMVGNPVIKVDDNTYVPFNIKRNSVRIQTQKTYGIGSLWIADIVHMPFGCSVWPSMWTKGQNWPNDGEIDIIENINLAADNQMALHTTPGCMNVSPAPPGQRGMSGALDCSADSGCTVVETAPNSFGAGFNNAKGGVYATQFDLSGIYIWFWSRPNIPKSIINSTSTSAIANFSDWGPPAASYPSGANCNTSDHFSEQNIVLSITLCGTWAGNPQFYSPQCGSVGSTGKCYDDNVVGSGRNYVEAYFEIQYIRTYTVKNDTISPSGSGASPSSTGSSAPPIDRSSFEGLVVPLVGTVLASFAGLVMILIPFLL